MRARLRDVVGPEPPVEADRGVERLEDRVLGLGEARHARHHAAHGARRARRPSGRPGRELLYVSAAPYYDAYAGGARRARRLLRRLYPPRRPHRELGDLPRRASRRRGGRACSPPSRPRRATSWRAASCAHARAHAAVALPGSCATCAPPATVSPQPAARRALRRRARHRPGIRRRGVATRAARRGRAPGARAGLGGVALDTGLAEPAPPARSTSARLRRARAAPRARRAHRARGRRLRLRRLRQERAMSPRPSASATRATWPSVISGKNGSASERAATSSQTGNSPSRWPKRSR